VRLVNPALLRPFRPYEVVSLQALYAMPRLVNATVERRTRKYLTLRLVTAVGAVDLAVARSAPLSTRAT